jgi:uncharacterized caspase-like protein
VISRIFAVSAALWVLFGWTSGSAFAERRVALVIGDAGYQNVSPLPHPARDAAAIAAMLKHTGFDVIESQADLANLDMRRLLRKFEDEANDADIAVVYYAGYGIAVGGTNYLIPIDARLASANDVDDEAVSLDRIMVALESVRRLRLVIIDACRENPFAKTMHRKSAGLSVGHGLAGVNLTASNTLVAFACKSGTTAEEGRGEHSPYTAALLDHLATPGLDVRLAFGRVRDEVVNKTDNKQSPFVYGSLSGSAVALVVKSGAPSVAIEPRSDAQASTAAPQHQATEDAAKRAGTELKQKAAEPSRPTLAERRVALVIGNSAYVHVPRLANPANDARLMAETLKGLGFALVSGGAQIDLDKAALDRAVQAFGNALTGADVGLFYYAGHGVQIRGANYLVPVAADPVKEADVDFQMLDTNLVLRQMESAGTKLNIVILDACRNNPFGGRSLRSAGSGLATMQAPEGTLISFATQPGSVALDGSGGHSPFTQALAEAIRKPGLDVFRTFNQVGLAVAGITGGQQKPWVSLSPIKGEFYFSGAPGRSSAATAADEIAWSFVETNDVKGLQHFINQFPASRHASEAQAKLKQLQQKKDQIAALPATTRVTPGGKPAWLGVRIQQVTGEVAEALNVVPPRGALVAGIDEKGPAKGAIEVGDVIVAIDGKDVKEMRDLPRIVAGAPIGRDVAITIIRRGKAMVEHVTLGRLPDQNKRR